MSAINAAGIHQKTGFHLGDGALRNPCSLRCQRGRPFALFALAFELSRDVTSLVETSASATRQTPTRSIVLLAAAGFASQAQIRVTDSLLPQIAVDLHTTIGVAAIVVTTYAITHGLIQFVAGPVADRFGKFRLVAIASVLATVFVALCGMSASLPQLALARFATGAVAGWVIPISMAYVGDVTPYERRQPVRIGLYPRAIVRPGRRRRTRRLARLAQRLLRARRHVRRGGGRALVRTHRRSANARAVGSIRGAARHRCGLQGRAGQSVCPHYSRGRLRRGRLGVGRLRLHRRRLARALRPELYADRHHRRFLASADSSMRDWCGGWSFGSARYA